MWTSVPGSRLDADHPEIGVLIPRRSTLTAAAKPVLEINPRHNLVRSLAALPDEDRAFKEDAAHMLFEEARVLDGERPSDALDFSRRLGRIISRGLRVEQR